MKREKKSYHPDFLKYMKEIVRHPNYAGLAIEKKTDGEYRWLAPADSETGRARVEWARQKAKELNIPEQAGMYADVMLLIHPTKQKPCQICGKTMSLYYHYPHATFLKGLNQHFGTAFTTCDHIGDIWDELIALGHNKEDIGKFLIEKGGLNLDPKKVEKEELLDALEYACRKLNKKCLGPGAMSNFPDRFDGFHSYNRCCRSRHDKGRSKENMKAYTRDRRAYEYWSDGNIHAANQFMGSQFFKNISADHIGPISLGFVHDPRYLQPMRGGDNSAKRDRLQVNDIEKIIATEKRTNVYPMSWYSKELWEFIRQNYANNPQKVPTVYRDALKQNMANFMHVLFVILKECEDYGREVLSKLFLEPHMAYFQYSYTFNANGEIIQQVPRHFTGRNSDEFKRYERIAFDAVYDYEDKKNRNLHNDLTPSEEKALSQICEKINALSDTEVIKTDIKSLLVTIETRLIAELQS